ncbi:MAG: ATP-binding protein [Azoarcus sp.]|jgi:predicted AAA+ superfamily ATPase|nr:ATP-binding protein [Azoarcus sp.]
MYISRHIETAVRRLASRKPVVVVTGARQVGKATLLETAFSDIRHIAMDNPLVRQTAINNPSVFFDTYPSPIVVDEIQKAGHLFEYIKERVDTNKNKGQFYLTGSQSLGLMKNVSESLAGRAGIVKMLGISMRELNNIQHSAPFIPTPLHTESFIKASVTFNYNTLITRIHKGFFPELYETESNLDDWSDFYSSYFQTYIEKDIRDILNIQDESAFIKFVRAVAALSGQVLNYSTLSEICGKDNKTVKHWLSALESSGLVFLLEPYYNNHNKRLIKTPKLYLLDTGFLCWLLGWNTPEQLIHGAMWGAIFETFVIAEVLKSYFNHGLSKPTLFYYRDKDKNEIDLLIQDGETLHPVEIKADSNPSPSLISPFRLLETIPGVKRGTGAVLCMSPHALPLTETDMILPANMI